MNSVSTASNRSRFPNPKTRGVVVAGGLLLMVAACQPKPVEKAVAPISATLAAGTPIPLVLVATLESGGSPEGSTVPFLVAEDVKDASGHTLIAKGSPVQGKVTWSRREEMMGGLMNRPARLKVDLVETVDVSGQPVALCADTSKPEEAYEFNRGNTGTEEASASIQTLLDDDQNKAVVQALNDTLAGTDNALLQAEENRQRLAGIADQLQMPALSKLARENRLSEVKSTMATVRAADPVATLAKTLTAQASIVTAVMEWTGVSRSIGSRLDGLTHGRNIKAYIGTPIQAFVERDGTVQVPGK